ncbi:haloacid dehalogenase superfamily, subfamily IA, variant 3 with third motif having DD or ED/haloacid dehalogenase superfamily, subfamily IA, variant 1 with third motif having Dx(3-4)D or Dx(3-4)E [Amycolatopsis arida]|uniref:Haloacid dehalogenase superfamily, subfamily IA, variant 3 with third motif having DD or ED/haloacid dehalogenase superfamily, subfamily IA, variant 1 with third motif having Dx(3-4)D or Dx(3-4)E n=1 Tax=Amycolatopsis arida TaxID=587909 RepID=A0A1I5YKV1_9PSEU|nr:HAD-IA family hydrolase [Amycolatopsis arida]TDX90582.1 HAD superfamily hydrolase (TIGR01509 family)/HAD superfamily hydrolase (TIGR01549 family) [Amycolatopsis arida]SFQ44725.1 haloacid dehalogenase superfamily, subfamily IA, variant 3 with third motif having DD or ED/haloacid dehalogenase superfamily, subfamily IA, variant 1 with third motif having Dx(3-4)D or Dx(3-4)E [Amycolatopsis arida]
MGGVGPGRPVTVVVFDFDGTLFHLPVDWAALRHDLGIDERARIGDLLQRAMDEGDTATLAVVDEHERAAARAGEFTPGSPDCLAALRERCRVAVLTRNTRDAVRIALGRHADDLLVVGREDVRRLKPDPEGLHAVLARFGAEPGEAALVGDTHHDVRAAAAAGARSVVVRNPRLRYAPEGADHYVDDLTVDLLDVLRRPPAEFPAPGRSVPSDGPTH